MTTLNQVVATTSSYLLSKASAIMHALSGEMHCTTGHLELALSMLALILVSLFALNGVLASDYGVDLAIRNNFATKTCTAVEGFSDPSEQACTQACSALAIAVSIRFFNKAYTPLVPFP